MDATQPSKAAPGENPDREPARRRRFPFSTVASVLVVVLIALVALILVGTKMDGVPSGIVFGLAFASLGRRLEPVWGLLSAILAMAFIVFWGVSQRAAIAPVPAASTDPDSPSRLTSRGARGLAVAAVVLFIFLQALMATHVGVTQALKEQRLRSGEPTRLAAEAFLRDLYYGNLDAARAAMTPSYQKAFPRENLRKYVKEWRDSFEALDALDPKGYFYGISGDGPYTGIDYHYRGSGGEGMLRLHLVQSGREWKVAFFFFAVKEDQPGVQGPVGPTAPAPPGGR